MVKGKGQTQNWLIIAPLPAAKQAVNEINNSKECLLALRDADNQLKFIQKEVEKLKQEEQQLASRIQRLKNEKRQEQSIQQSQSQPQLKQQSVFMVLAQAAQQALANDELHTQAP